MSSLDEKLLIYKLTTKKDPESYGQLYDLYVEKIYRFIYFKIGNRQEAEDLTSEVFLKTWNHINEDRGVESFSGLLYRIARNVVIDWYRERAREPVIVSLETEIESGENNVADNWFKQMDLKMETQAILQAVKKMKQEYQEVIMLRYVDELSIEEISEVIKKKNLATRVLLHRATQKLKDLLEVPKNK